MDGVNGWTKLRNYEVSVWTLQDNYITTLKSGDPIYTYNTDPLPPAVAWPQARAQGQIQNGQMEINIDGTQTLSFDIPMYIYVNGERIENPNWYSAQDKNILTSMRKIKVVFNKWQNSSSEQRTQSTFEFIILKVSETHEQDNLTCHVECEGLAFHELGKVGYKRSLTTDEFNNEYNDWASTLETDYTAPDTKAAHEPIANLQYWMSKAKIDPKPANASDINPTKWYYEIRMAHSSLVHETMVYSDKIYEEGYPVDWTNEQIPTGFMEVREMARLVDINESNLYNITQDLAEKFQVFCRYEYLYDMNYTIIGRVIVFYNNFLQEGNGVQTLIYPNSASKIVRTMDSTDVSTKLYVRSVDAADQYTGEINIMDCRANPTREDYILNFDYLHDIGTISDEQYEEIKEYNKEMRRLNDIITPLQSALSNLIAVQIDLKAKVSNLSASVDEDTERITETAAYINELDKMDGDLDGFITRDYMNPYILTLLKNSTDPYYDTYYVQFNNSDDCRGIDPSTIELYEQYNSTAKTDYTYWVSYSPFGSNFASGNTITSSPATEYDYELEYKCTVGTGADITSLPINTQKKGWIYKTTSDGINDSGNTAGDLLLWNGSSWVVISKGANNANNGFFIYTRARTQQLNGPSNETCTCIRESAKKNVITEYIKKIRRLYYVTLSSTAPSKPIVESNTSVGTDIYNKNILDAWSSFLSTPDDVTAIDNYHVYATWETTNSNGEVTYSAVTQLIKSKASDHVGGLKSINQAIQTAKTARLQSRVTGEYRHDEYGNLDKIENIYVSKKQGTYHNYKLLAGPQSSALFDSGINIKLFMSSAVDMKLPAEKQNEYVLITEEKNYLNTNTSYSCRVKYYNNYGVETTVPDDIKASGAHYMASIDQIFYLKTDSNATLPTSNLTVTNNDGTDQWTTVIPDKTDSSWKYYSGWMVTEYNGTKSYIVNSNEDNSLKSKPTYINTEYSIPQYVYAIFKYKPDWYYENIKNSWIKKKVLDEGELELNTTKLDLTNALIEQLQADIQEKIDEKNEKVLKFERMMGAALREGYWQPEDEYQDYGTRYQKDITFELQNLYPNNSTFISYDDLSYGGWDSVTFENEQKLYYEVGVDKQKVYYPCIDLSKLTAPDAEPDDGMLHFLQRYKKWAEDAYEGSITGTSIDYTNNSPFAFTFNPTNLTIPVDDNNLDIRYCKNYVIGSGAELAFVREQYGSDPLGRVKPVLILTEASSLSDDELEHLYSTGMVGRIFTEIDENNHHIVQTHKQETYTIPSSAWMNVTLSDNKWVTCDSIANCDIVYPRILIESLKLKNNTKDLVLDSNDTILENYKDYSVLVQTYYKSNPVGNKMMLQELVSATADQLQSSENIITYYTITIKPEVILRNVNFQELFNSGSGDLYTDNFSIKVFYSISNADVDVYLDALKISKENAYPKVEYEIEVSKWSHDLLVNLYTKMAQLVMINDTELKLQNTFGYISDIKLDLDHEEQDTVEIKNYKTKFEDLFSKIVAETEEMHKNSRNIGLAGVLASGEPADVTLSPEALSNTLNNVSNKDLLLAFLNEYFDDASVVQEKLQELWDEAGTILGSAASSLNSVISTTTKNASILAGFRENVAAALTPKIYTGSVQPTNFKPGDIWINEEAGYYGVATGYSGRGGFTRTHDGTLAEISGASIDIDAEAGDISITGETQINLMSGKNIYIAAGDTVDIVGNKEVNIGGTTINMASYTDSNHSGSSGGIHLVSTEYTTSSENISRVDVHGDGIELASKNGIIIKSGAGIDIKSSSGENVSVVQIDKSKGVWIGSDKTIALFTGSGGVENTASGASVELSPSHLLLGVSEGSSGTAIELSKDQIVLAAGGSTSSIKSTTLTSNSSLSGLQMKKDYIGMATGSGTDRSIFSLTPGEIKLGTMTGSGDSPSNYTGDFLWLKKGDVYIGSSGNLTLNTDNIKIQTKLLTSGTASANDSTKSAVSKMGFVLGKNLNSSTTSSREPRFGFWIDTDDNAHLVVDGNITAQTFIANSGTKRLMADSSHLGFYSATTSGNTTTYDEILTISGSAISVANDFALNVNGNFKLISDIESNSTRTAYFRIQTSYLTSSTTSGSFIMFKGAAWNSCDSGIKFSTSNGLEIKGNITATSFTLGDGVEIPYSSISDKPIIPNPSDFTIDGLSTIYRKMRTVDATYSGFDGNEWTKINKYSDSVNYSVGDYVLANDDDKNGYRVIKAKSANVGGFTDEYFRREYERTVQVSSTNSLVLGANGGLYVLKDNTSALDDSYLAINKNKINLDYNEDNYIHINNKGIHMYSANITINDRPIWFNDRIKFGITKPQAPDLSDYPSDDRAWIWIQPNQFSQWTYSQQSGSTVSSSNDMATVTLNNSVTQPISDANGTSYTYEVSFTFTPNTEHASDWAIKVQLTSNDGTRIVEFSPSSLFAPSLSGNTFSFSTQITAANDNANTSGSNVCNTNTVKLKVGLYSISNQQWGADAGYNSSGFKITNVVMRAGTNSANNGTFPCTVYYIKE